MKNKFKTWLIALKTENPVLTINTVAEILNRTPKEVEGFLYAPTRFPNFEDVTRAHYFLVEARLNEPTEMRLFIYSVKSGSRALACKHFPVADRAIKSHERSKRYLHNGELKTILEIAQGNRKKANCLSRAIYRNAITDGADVAEILATIGTTNIRKRYVFQGELRTAKEISDLSGINQAAISKSFHNINENSNVDEVLTTLKTTTHRKFMFLGELCNQVSISEKTGIDPAIISKKLKGIDGGADVTGLFNKSLNP